MNEEVMANGEQSYTVKEMLAMFQLQMNTRLDKIESKLDEKASMSDIREAESRLAKLEQETVTQAVDRDKLERLEKNVQDLVSVAVNPEKVKSIVADAFDESEQRGWTKRERLIGVAVGCITILNTLLSILALGPDLFGGHGGK